MRSVLTRTNRALQSSHRSLLLLEDGPSSQSRSRLPRDPKRWTTRRRVALHFTIGDAVAGYLLSLASRLLLLLSRLASGGVSVAQWLVDFGVDPQTVQKHRKLPRHGHRRSLL